MKFVSVQGYNGDIDVGTEDIIPDGATRTFPTAAAATTVVSSSANDDGSPVGTGARTVRVTGLDANYAQISEDVIMNGTGAVTLVKEFFRVLEIEVLTVGSGLVSDGIIYVKHSSTIIAYLEAGKNTTRSATYTCSKNFANWALKAVHGMITDVTDGVVIFTLQTRVQGGNWVDRRTFVAHGVNQPSVDIKFAVPMHLAIGEDIRLQGDASAASTVVLGGFDLVGSSAPIGL